MKIRKKPHDDYKGSGFVDQPRKGMPLPKYMRCSQCGMWVLITEFMQHRKDKCKTGGIDFLEWQKKQKDKSE